MVGVVIVALLLIGSLRSFYGDAEDNVDYKNEFIFYLGISGYS